MSYVRSVRLRVPSCVARPGPAIGQALGPLGINMAEFCKKFNEYTEPIYNKDVPLTVHLHAMSDRSFTFDVQSPSTSYLLKKAAGLDKGSSNPGEENVGFVTPEIVYHIAKLKSGDECTAHVPLEGVARSVIGTARSMGIQIQEAVVEDDNEVVEEA